MPATADQFSNFGSSIVAGGAGGPGTALQAGDTTLTVKAGDGAAKFPATAPFMVLFPSGAQGELAKCTTKSGDTLTLVRGQEGTAAQLWPAGTVVQCVVTAGSLSDVWSALNRGRAFYADDYGAVGDGATDDAAAIQSAIVACQAAGGGTVRLSAKPYRLKSAGLVVTADNVQLVGEGWATTLIADAALAGGTPLVWVQAPATGYRYGIKVADIMFVGGDLTGPLAVQLDSTYHARLQRVRFSHFGGTSVFLNGSASYYGAYTRFDQCEWENGGAGTAVKTTNHEWNHVDGGHISWYNQTGGIGLWFTSGNNRVIGLSTDECDTAVLVDNCKLVSINGCGFDRGVTRHIRLKGAQECAIVGNRFHDFAGTGSKAMIDVDSAANAGNVIVGNTCLTGTGWTWFIHESGNLGPAPNTYANNETTGKPIAMQNASAGGGIARQNRGYNPVGVLGPPAVPASGTALTNGYGVDCQVYITSGTVQSVLLGGMTTGLTAGMVRVPAWSAVTLNYSTAPSWTWFGE